LKTIEYKNILQKSKEKKEEKNDNKEPLNTNVPMECPDKLYFIPQEEVCTFIRLYSAKTISNIKFYTF